MPSLVSWKTGMVLADSANALTGDPFCTVFARAPIAAEAEQIVKQRAAAILAMLDTRLHDELSTH